MQYQYDPAGNPILTTSSEVATIADPPTGLVTETFQSAMYYDCLGRLVMTAQQGPDGNLDVGLVPCPPTAMWSQPGSALITLAGYDSRGNQTLAVDPKGNSTVSVFDGASRGLQTIQHLRLAGQGQNGAAPGTSLLPFNAGTITTTQVLDGNGNLLQLIDDRGGVTSFTYDTLDRETIMTFHDGSTRTRAYDEANDVVTYTDENGSLFANTFDPAGRTTVVAITPAAGVAGHSGFAVAGTTAQSFQYDGLARTTQAVDTSSSAAAATVNIVYDSLSRVLEESQTYGGNTRNVTNDAFTSYPVSGFMFPYAAPFTSPNGRVLTNTYDALYRRTQVEESMGSTNIASWAFFGPSRVAEVTLGNGLICAWMNNARTRSAVQSGVSNPPWGNQSSDRLGYDGSGRPITKRYLLATVGSDSYSSTNAVVGFTTAYDAASNKLYERGLHCESRDHLYQAYDPTSNSPLAGCYDSQDRLLQYQRGVLSASGGPSNVGGGQITTPISLPNADKTRSYALDGLGNWRRTLYDPGLVGHWRFPEGAGTTTADSSGFGNTGTLVNGPTWSDNLPTPLQGSGVDSLDFNGSNQYVDLGASATLSLTGPITISVWVNITAVPGSGSYPRILSNFDLSNGYELLVSTAGAYFQCANGSALKTVHDTTSLAANTWTHLAATYDALDTACFYHNGQLVATNASFGATAIGSSGDHVNLARAPGYPSTNYFSGNLADARIYDRALSAAEIAAIATQTPGGQNQITEVRQHNGVNQITRAVEGSTNPLAIATTNFQYDHGNNGSNTDPSIARRGNGNLANDGIRSYTWDALNRLMEVERVSDGAVIQQAAYDAFNRRIQVAISNGGLSTTIPDSTTGFIYLGWRRVEERQTIDDADAPTKQYIWGIYLDECVQQRQLVPLNGFAPSAAEDLYPLQDLLYRTIGLADSSGVVREAYDYDAYGNTLIFRTSDSSPATIPWLYSDRQVLFPTCDVLFTGQKYDAETIEYYYRERYYIPQWARFGSRDPIGFDSGDWNLYRYVGSRPLSFTDPIGLEPPNAASKASGKYCPIGGNQPTAPAVLPWKRPKFKFGRTTPPRVVPTPGRGGGAIGGTQSPSKTPVPWWRRFPRIWTWPDNEGGNIREQYWGPGSEWPPGPPFRIVPLPEPEPRETFPPPIEE